MEDCRGGNSVFYQRHSPAAIAGLSAGTFASYRRGVTVGLSDSAVRCRFLTGAARFSASAGRWRLTRSGSPLK